MENFIVTKEKLAREIFRKYSHEDWIIAACDRNVRRIPKDIQALYSRFYRVWKSTAYTPNEQREQIAELDRILKKFKRYFKQLERQQKVKSILRKVRSYVKKHFPKA